MVLSTVYIVWRGLKMKLSQEEIREKYCHDFDEFGICIYCHCKATDYERDNKENAQAHGE